MEKICTSRKTYHAVILTCNCHVYFCKHTIFLDNWCVFFVSTSESTYLTIYKTRTRFFYFSKYLSYYIPDTHPSCLLPQTFLLLNTSQGPIVSTSAFTYFLYIWCTHIMSAIYLQPRSYFNKHRSDTTFQSSINHFKILLTFSFLEQRKIAEKNDEFSKLFI